MEYRDYYATLGVDKSASQADIKKAFRRLARENHPDVNKGDAAAEKRFKEISAAYDVLGDISRDQYQGVPMPPFQKPPPEGAPLVPAPPKLPPHPPAPCRSCPSTSRP